MNATRCLYLALTLTAALPARATDPVRPHYYRTSLGLSAGWGAPYGWGLNVGRFVGEQWEATVGGGVAASGPKLGAGVRYYLRPQEATSPYLGSNLVYSGRLRGQTASFGTDLPYDVRPNAVLHLRSGLRWRGGRVSLLGTVGYGIRLGGSPVRFHEPAPGQPGPRPETVRMARAFSPGGLEISWGLSIGLGRR